jgi:HSP20 family protein
MLLTSFDPFVYEFDRLARRTFGSWDARTFNGSFMRVDAIRSKDEVVLHFDLPGIDPDTIEVTVDRGVLTVSAKRSEEYGEDAKPFIRERVTGAFTRRLYLADTLDADKLSAAYDNGVLTVRVPVQEKALPRKVEVEHAEAKKLTA